MWPLGELEGLLGRGVCPQTLHNNIKVPFIPNPKATQHNCLGFELIIDNQTHNVLVSAV